MKISHLLATSALLLASSWASAQQVIEYGRFTAEKLGNTINLRVESFGLSELIIQNVEHKTKVIRVTVNTDRGSYELGQLRAELNNNESVRAVLNPSDYIYNVQLEVAGSFRGSRGRFFVQGVIDRVHGRPGRPRPGRPAPLPPPHSGYGPYDSWEAREIRDLLYNFGWSMNGLNLFSQDAQRMADNWVFRGRECGSPSLVRDIIYRFESNYQHYRRGPNWSDARHLALRDIRHMSRCTDLFQVRF